MAEQQADDANTVNFLEQKLRQQDAVMEPDVWNTLKRYVNPATGGNPQTAVELLSEHYVGYAHMVGLVVSWINQLSPESASAEQQAPPSSEFQLMCEVVKQHFDPDKFAGIFQKGGSGPPKWLDALASHREGRQLVYDLSSRHRGSLLLNYAMQKILRAGHEEEVAEVGPSLASYFGVFHRLMATRLREAVGAGVPALQRIAQDLKDSCCHAQHTYAHLQLVLTALARQPNGAAFEYLSEEVERRMAAEHGWGVWRMFPWFLPGPCADSDVVAADMVASFLASPVRAERGLHIDNLHRLYMSADPPPLRLLRHHQVIRQLTEDLFLAEAPAMELGAARIASLVGLLGLAHAAVDSRPEGSLDTSEVPAAQQAVEAALSISQSAAAGARLTPQQLEDLPKAAGVSVAAAGMLQAVGQATGSLATWRDASQAFAAPANLAVLAAVVRGQPQLHGRAVKVVFEALAAIGSSKADVSRSFLDMAVLLLRGPQAMEVMNEAVRWSRSADPSFVRHFVFQALSLAAPPYSPDFATILIRLMTDSRVKRSRGVGQRNAGQLAALDEFVKCAGKLELSLGAREAAFLNGLSTSVQ